MWHIGDIPVRGRTVLGPMSGYTSVSYRGFMRDFGSTVAVTEMISARGLMNEPGGSEPYLRSAEGQITGVQLFGKDPKVVAQGASLALRINPKLCFVDINMGCPVPKIIHRGAGSALLSDPEACGSMVRAVKREIGTPVTCKIRLGRDEGSINFRDVVDELISADVDMIAIHSRTANQRYSGDVRHGLLFELCDGSPVPIVVSGNIGTVEEASDALKESGADAVMIARGGVGNPYLVTRTERFLEDGTALEDPTIRQQVDWCLKLMDATVEEMGADTAAKRLRSIVPKFLSGCRYSREYSRSMTGRDVHVEDMVHVLERVRSESGDEPFRPRAERSWGIG